MSDPIAVESFLSQIYPRLIRFAFRLCRHRQDAEDIAQDTCLKVFEHAQQIRCPDRLDSWTFQIARNAWKMRCRKRAPALLLPLEESIMDLTDPTPSQEEQALLQELLDSLRLAIRELPPAYRSIIAMRDLHETPGVVVAKSLSVSPEVVRTRLRRARLRLRKQMPDHL